MDEALGRTIGPRSNHRGRGPASRRSAVPRSWLVWPWLAWSRAPGVERVAGVVYSTVAGRSLKLDLYRPPGRRHDCPVLVEIHGGGWITGDRRLEARPLMAHMAARGWVCVSVDYRVGRTATWPDQIIDVNSALAWVHEHVSEYGGDPDFVAITGGSAGGHLAALAALAPDDVDYRPPSGTAAVIRACVPFYGPYDFDNSLGLHPPGEMRFVERFVVKVPLADDPTRYERGAPLARVHQDAPAFLVVQGTSDNLVFPSRVPCLRRQAPHHLTSGRRVRRSTPRPARVRCRRVRADQPRHQRCGALPQPRPLGAPPDGAIVDNGLSSVPLATRPTAADMLAQTPGSSVRSTDQREIRAVATPHAEPSRSDVRGRPAGSRSADRPGPRRRRGGGCGISRRCPVGAATGHRVGPTHAPTWSSVRRSAASSRRCCALACRPTTSPRGRQASNRFPPRRRHGR